MSCQDPHPIQPLYYTSSLTRCWARCHPPVTTPVRNTRLGGSYNPYELKGPTPSNPCSPYSLLNAVGHADTLQSIPLWGTQGLVAHTALMVSQAYTLQPLYSTSPLTRFRARCYLPVTPLLRYTNPDSHPPTLVFHISYHTLSGTLLFSIYFPCQELKSWWMLQPLLLAESTPYNTSSHLHNFHDYEATLLSTGNSYIHHNNNSKISSKFALVSLYIINNSYPTLSASTNYKVSWSNTRQV